MEKYTVLDNNGEIILDSNFMIKGEICNAGSKSLENYVAPFNAHVVNRLMETGETIYGQGDITEFAMKEGLNGSIEAVKAGDCKLGISTDTGGNLVRDLGYEGITGFIPTKGTVSSYGIISASSSFTRAGLIGDFENILRVLNIVGGYDSKDPMSLKTEMDLEFFELNVEDYKFGIYGILESKALEFFNEILEISFEYNHLIKSVFDVIKSVEVASSTAKFDGIRYGYVTDSYESIDELFAKTRAEAFGLDIKKDIIKGNIYAGHSYERDIYENAIRLRRILVSELDRVFNEVDFIVGNVNTDLPILASLGNRPVAVVDDFAIVGNLYEDEKLLNIAKKIKEVL